MRVLVLDGGGQLGTFQWGVMCELAKRGMNYPFFDAYIATSAGVFNSAYFLTEQFEEGKEIWLKYLPQMFWKPFKNDMVALEKILKDIVPLNYELVQQRKQKILMCLTNMETMQPEFLHVNKEADTINALLAGCAMPFYSGPRKLHGHMYFDGGLTDQPPIGEALSMHADEIWLIMTQPFGYRLSKLTWRLISFLSLFDRNTRTLLANVPYKQNSALAYIERDSNLKVIRPKKTLPISYRSTNKELILKTFKLGVNTAKEFLYENRI